jgi:hypothetical protein
MLASSGGPDISDGSLMGNLCPKLEHLKHTFSLDLLYDAASMVFRSG